MIDSNFHIILASNSPRRRELLAGLDIPFEVKVLPDIEENYPADLAVTEIAAYIAHEKADAYRPTMGDNDLIITADTIVVVDDEVLGKPHDAADACRMLRKLSNKAGAYGIQEWIGYVGVTSLQGSYFNVMGLPVQRIYAELSAM